MHVNIILFQIIVLNYTAMFLVLPVGMVKILTFSAFQNMSFMTDTAVHTNEILLRFIQDFVLNKSATIILWV